MRRGTTPNWTSSKQDAGSDTGPEEPDGGTEEFGGSSAGRSGGQVSCVARRRDGGSEEPVVARRSRWWLGGSNRFEASEEEGAAIKGLRGEEKEAMQAKIMAAIESESNSVLASFGAEDLAKIMLITIKAAVPAMVKVVQKQLSASVDCYRLDRNILESRYSEDEFEQCSRKENVRVTGIDVSQHETEEQLVTVVCQLATAAGVNIIKNDISTSHRLGARKQGKSRPTIVRFVSRRKNKSELKNKDEYKEVYISDDLT
ncbi:uncharacterized protein LOC126404350 [Xyrichtys novacula]|uniref:Uncharacterized protein LOC126404350 n=1 Tax=Xyrichtys novacula TaxID=13765 RepID=A0AAV1GBI2_XYRNO|nr:uncharacterized protein LOC126404350 [Xyrichtys novacula]